jgi:hypothetical protein
MNTQPVNRILKVISEQFFDEVIFVIDDLVFVNLDWLTNRNYQFEGVNEFLYTINQYKNHKLIFLIRDGINPRFTGVTEIIKQVIRNLDLNDENCYIYGYDNPCISKTTYLALDAVSMWSGLTHAIIKNLPISNNRFLKHLQLYDLLTKKQYCSPFSKKKI